MAYPSTAFKGDSVHTIACKGDACVGDEVAFDRARFGNSLKCKTFLGFERVVGKIVNRSYVPGTRRGIFTVLLANGCITLIQGRALYAQGLWRKPWPDETLRKRVLAEKFPHCEDCVSRGRGRYKKGSYYYVG